MKRWGLALFGIVFIFSATVLVTGAETRPPKRGSQAAPGPKAPQAIWSGTSGGFTIRWTTADIQAWPLRKPGRLTFSAGDLSRRGFQNFLSSLGQDTPIKHITYERKFTVLSVVGSIISLKDELYYDIIPSAHPGGETRFTAIDLAKSGEAVYVSPPEADSFELDLARLGKVAKLTDYFQEKEVLEALGHSAIFKQTLGEERPQSLEKAFELLEEQHLEINGVPYSFPRDFLTRFAFHHLQGDRVAVRLGLPGAGGAARFMHTEIEILLPVPAALQESLTKAAAGKEGFLLEDQQKLAGESVTLIPFSFNRKGRMK
jgi:hypothetical protein